LSSAGTNFVSNRIVCDFERSSVAIHRSVKSWAVAVFGTSSKYDAHAVEPVCSRT